MDDIEKIKKDLRSALKNQNAYSKAMEKAVEAAADSILFAGKLAIELRGISGVFDDKDGNNVNVQKAYLWLKSSEYSLKWLRELHLTPDSIGADTTNEEVEELKRKVRDVRKG